METKTIVKEYNCPMWIDFLNEVTGGDAVAIKQLQEFAGSCLEPEGSWGKALILTGEGVGKTTFLKTLRRIVGDSKTSFIPISGFEDDYSRYELKDKWLNISRLKSAKELDRTYFKAVVTGDPMNAFNRDDECVNLEPFCKLAFETNIHLGRKRQGLNLQRRCLHIQLNCKPAEPDPELFEKLIKEIDGIRSWFHAGLQRLKNQDQFTLDVNDDDPLIFESLTSSPLPHDMYIMRCKSCQNVFWVHSMEPKYIDADFQKQRKKYEARGYTLETANLKTIVWCDCEDKGKSVTLSKTPACGPSEVKPE